ncbi:MAG: hypothetical protein GY909_13760 [Oligoflexia bacterium]|nr:hypothetical protein [Oligoflexia bacterium]
MSVPDDVKLGSLYFESYEYERAFRLLKGEDFKNVKKIPALLKIKDYYKVGGNIPDAVKVQERVVELKPKSLPAIEELEILYKWNGDVAKYLKTKEKRASLLIGSEAYIKLLFEIANEYRWYKLLPDSNRVFYEAYETGLLNQDQKIQIVEYLLASRQVDPAIAILNDLKNESIVFRNYLFEAYSLKNLVVKAIKEGVFLLTKIDYPQFNVRDLGWFRHIKTPNEESSKELIPDITELYKKLNDKKLYRDVLIETNKLYPNDMRTVIEIAYHYWDQGLKQEALKYFYKLKNAQKRRIFYFFEAATYFRDQADLETAKYFLEKVVKLTRKKKYLNELAQVYEELGMKKKALKLYLEIYKKFDSSSFRSIFASGTFYAQNGGTQLRSNSGFNKVYKEKINLEKKIIYLMQDLGESEKTEPFYKSILEKNPHDVEALKGLGYIYMTRGDDKKFEYFRKALDVDPTDEDSLLVMADYNVSTKNYEVADRYLKKLEKKKELPFVYELRFTILKNLDSSQLEDFCNEVYQKDIREYKFPIYSCYIEEKKYEEAFVIAQDDFEKSEKNEKDIVNFVYIASVSKNFDKAQEAIELARSKGQYTRAIYKSERELAFYMNDDKLKNAITLNTSFRWQDSEDLDFINTRVEVGKRKNDFEISAISEQYFFREVDNKKLFLNGLGLSYIQPTYKAKYSLLNASKSQESFLHKLDISHYSSKHFFLIALSKNDFEFPGKRAMKGNNSNKNQIQLYYETSEDNERVVQLTSSFKNVTLWNDENFNHISFSSLYWFPTFWKLYFSPIAIYTKKNSNAPLMDELYQDESKVYGLFVRRRWEFIERLFPSSNVFLKAGILGDLENDLALGELWVFELNFEREIGINKNINFNYRHDQSLESGRASGEIDQLSVNLNYWF